MVRYLPPDWMSYLLWYSRHTQAWVLELRDGKGLIVMDENRDLARNDVYAAQSWACTCWTDRLDERCYAWLPVTVTRRRGWTPMFDPHWRHSRLYHDLHRARDAASCCTW
ncbi:hypothetical protein [Paractinoplanes rishiriensis]|uniref:hypothetical protein n=1 Tax=Paractinoplanes rishiriensis TaxID=1050105 RepID=UPI0019440321|nr:hypothetical protein [Actinoplanes rishiriensis]